VIKKKKTPLVKKIPQVKKRILVVDDEAPLAEMIAEYCEALGFRAKSLTSGEHMMEEVKAFSPDLITMDLSMPGMSGLEAIRILRGAPETKHIPILIISAVADNPDAVRDVLKQCEGILKKPLRIKTMKERIESIL